MILSNNLISNNKKIFINVIVFLVVIDVVLLSYYLIFKKNSNVAKQYVKVNYDKSNSAYFAPNVKEKFLVDISGKLELIPVEQRELDSSHSLFNEQTKKIIYLISDQHDLNLFTGLNVTLNGEIVGKTNSGVDLVDVKTISLK